MKTSVVNRLGRTKILIVPSNQSSNGPMTLILIVYSVKTRKTAANEWEMKTICSAKNALRYRFAITKYSNTIAFSRHGLFITFMEEYLNTYFASEHYEENPRRFCSH